MRRSIPVKTHTQTHRRHTHTHIQIRIIGLPRASSGRQLPVKKDKFEKCLSKMTGRQVPRNVIDRDTPSAGIDLHEAEAFEAKASASVSWFQKLKASASASWLGKSFGFRFGFVTLQIQIFTFGFVVSKLEQTQHVCQYILPEFQQMSSIEG